MFFKMIMGELKQYKLKFSSTFMLILICGVSEFVLLVIPALFMDYITFGIFGGLGIIKGLLIIFFVPTYIFINIISLLNQGDLFHTSINTDVSYLTFTLPLSTEKLIKNKIIAGSIYLMYVKVLTILLFAILLRTYTGLSLEKELDLSADTYRIPFLGFLKLLDQITKNNLDSDFIIIIIGYTGATVYASALLFLSVAVSGGLEEPSKVISFIIYAFAFVSFEMIFLIIDLSLDSVYPTNSILYQVMFVIMKNLVLTFICYTASCYIVKKRCR